MKVYVLNRRIDYEGEQLCGVYSTIELARDAQRLADAADGWSYHAIYVVDVNAKHTTDQKEVR